MTKPASLTHSVLLRSCAPTALAVAAAALPNAAMAQAFQGSPSTIQGTVAYDRATPGVETVTVQGVDAIIDWTPATDVNGAALTFLPDGNTAVFQGAPGETNFAVLNRILPTATFTPTEFAGTVQAFLTDGAGNITGPGGFIAFYSPTGILVSGTAVFQVPQLLLTTNEPDDASFSDFASGVGPLLLSGNFGLVDIQPGATLTGTPEDSFFIVSASNINMAGDAYFNGSSVYAAGLDVQMSHSSGLFDIFITNGTEGQAISHTGNTGGPASTGAGDNHIIYGVARATSVESGGASMLFSGNLGFDVAATATVANGEIILSANYDVEGRQIDGGSTGQGADSFFNGRGFIPFDIAEVTLDGLATTSNLTAISTHLAQVTTSLGSSDFAGDLVVVGRSQAQVNATTGTTISVGGDLFVSANNFFGAESNSFPNAVTGGVAYVSADTNGQIIVAGRSTVTANGYAEIDDGGTFAGNATGGQAQVLAIGGTIQFGDDLSVSANGQVEDETAPYDSAGGYQGGFAEFTALDGGSLTLDGGLDISAFAASPNLTGANAYIPGDSTGGTIYIGTGDGGGLVSITNGFIVADASGIVGDGFSSDGDGATGTGGTITLVSSPGDVFSVGGDTYLYANGFGGNVVGNVFGGSGIGGTIDIFAGSNMLFDGALVLDTYASGGYGANGGTGHGGINSIYASSATVTINGLSQSYAIGEGGAAIDAGNGGTGFGGTAQVLVNQGGQLLMNGSEMQLNVDAYGGSAISGTGGDALGGDGFVFVDGSTASFAGDLFFSGIAFGGASSGGTGGTGASSTESLLLHVTNGSAMSIAGLFSQSAIGVGGNGVTGGAGYGGAAGLFVDLDGTLSLNISNLNAEGIGGTGTTGDDGAGVGGTVVIEVNQGTLSATDAQTYNVSGSGSAQSVAGTFGIIAVDGDIALPIVDIFVGGDNPAPFASSFFADGGTITIDDLLTVDMVGDLIFEYANGGTILGGASPNSLSASFDVLADGTIVIIGDSTADRFFAAQSLQLAAQQIVIDPQVNFGGTSVALISLDTQHRNILGGSTEGPGFMLTDEEIAAVTADSLTIRTPDTVDPDVDLTVLDLNLVGSLASGETSVTIISDGVMQITGGISYDAAGPGDSLALLGGSSLQMLLPDAHIAVLDANGALSGSLLLSADNLIFSVSDYTAIILSDPDSAAISDLLNDLSLTVETGPFNYIAAHSVSLAATDYIYGQNTGDGIHFGGIEISAPDGTLSISQIDPQASTTPLVVIAYGMAYDSSTGDFVFDDDFFFRRIVDRTLIGPFTGEATLNDCIINLATCGTTTLTGPGSPPNHDLVKDPLDNEDIQEEAVPGTPTSDEAFGLDFPGLINAPIMPEDEVVRDPVTSGGDSALYSLGARRNSAGDGVEGGDN